MKSTINYLGVIESNIYEFYIEHGLQVIHFLMPEDTDAFCRLVECSVHKDDEVIDLGCGDGLATIHAFESGAKHVLGVDISETAVQSTLDNLNIWSRNNKKVNIEVVQHEMLDFIRINKAPLEKINATLIISNPPYIPIGMTPAIGAVDGGKNGLKYIAPLIENSIVERISWLQGSISDPFEVMRLLNENLWEIERILMFAVKFRENAQKQLPYLRQLKEGDRSYFFSDKNEHWFIKLGFVCEKQKKIGTLHNDDSLLAALKIFSDVGPYQFIESARKIRFSIPVEYGIYPN